MQVNTDIQNALKNSNNMSIEILKIFLPMWDQVMWNGSCTYLVNLLILNIIVSLDSFFF